MWLNAALDLDRPDLHDTMVMSQVFYTGTRAALNSNFSHSLQAVVKRELKLEIDKEHQKSNWGAMALTREQIVYAARDAHVMPKLAETLMRKIEKAGLLKVSSSSGASPTPYTPWSAAESPCTGISSR